MQARTRTIWLVRLAMAASLLAPLILFAFAAWNSLRSTEALTDERLARSLDVENEEAQRTFQLVGVALNGVVLVSPAKVGSCSFKRALIRHDFQRARNTSRSK